MNYLIAGGSGLIGRALAAALLDQGHQVTVISRNPAAVSGFAGDVKLISWDPAALAAAAAGSQVLINLAGASLAGTNPLSMRWTPKRKSEILNSRLQAGERLTQAVIQADPKPDLLIQASAIGHYGSTGPGPVAESAQPGSDFLAEVCREWEASTASIEKQGVRRVVTRIGLVFSPRGGMLDLLRLPFRFFLGGPIGSGRQYLSWIHIQDLVGGIIYLSQDPSSRGAYNLTAPNPVQNQEFASLVSAALKRPSWFRIPSILLKTVLGEAATMALDGREVIPQRLLDSGFEFKYGQLGKALLDL